LKAEKIFARRYFYPSLNTFTDIVPYVKMQNSEDVANRILCLPLYYDLDKEDIKRIAKIIIQVN
jgi:hypothetical protein